MIHIFWNALFVGILSLQAKSILWILHQRLGIFFDLKTLPKSQIWQSTLCYDNQDKDEARIMLGLVEAINGEILRLDQWTMVINSV